MDHMERIGIVGPAEDGKARPVLIAASEVDRAVRLARGEAP
jgi:hypothetical protein